MQYFMVYLFVIFCCKFVTGIRYFFRRTQRNIQIKNKCYTYKLMIESLYYPSSHVRTVEACHIPTCYIFMIKLSLLMGSFNKSVLIGMSIESIVTISLYKVLCISWKQEIKFYKLVTLMVNLEHDRYDFRPVYVACVIYYQCQSLALFY